MRIIASFDVKRMFPNLNQICFMRNLSLFVISCFLLACQAESAPSNWTPLLDSELSQWDTYLSFQHQLGYDGEAPTNKNGELIEPIGANNDPYQVFQIIKEGDESVLKISGEFYGCVYTKEEYDNYHLRLQVKWGEKKWKPRKKLLRDSGILYHSIGENGAEHWRSWMLSQEFQVMEGHMGDFWNQATSAIDIRAYIPEYIMSPVADQSQPFITIGEDQEYDAYCMRSRNMEKPHGDWNQLELICFEGKSLHIVNGEVVMILQNSRYYKDGQAVSLQKGKIQIQSEAAELYYKNIEIQLLTTLPIEYESLFK